MGVECERDIEFFLNGQGLFSYKPQENLRDSILGPVLSHEAITGNLK